MSEEGLDAALDHITHAEKCDRCKNVIDHRTRHIGFASSDGTTLCFDCALPERVDVEEHLERIRVSRNGET